MKVEKFSPGLLQKLVSGTRSICFYAADLKKLGVKKIVPGATFTLQMNGGADKPEGALIDVVFTLERPSLIDARMFWCSHNLPDNPGGSDNDKQVASAKQNDSKDVAKQQGGSNEQEAKQNPKKGNATKAEPKTKVVKGKSASARRTGHKRSSKR